ncbi:GL21113 [Drosophila persimilis]|uniref:GL21113 n=1 Tax=Drosophila persimilis TaxID=7234 RepID=B4GWV3_DROPE|nr:GL21113 [Drosophila persimilis]
MKGFLQLLVLQLALKFVPAQDLKCSVDYVSLGDSAYKIERGKVLPYSVLQMKYLNQLGFGPDEAVWFSGFGIKSGAWISLANSKIQTYFKWASAEPNDLYSAENCLGIKANSGNWFMNDLSCFKEYSYLCEGIPKKTEDNELAV